MTSNDEHLEMAIYFWKERGDPSRYAYWDETRAAYPELQRAWERYKDAERDLGLLLESLESKTCR